jgi:hypothetical protein
VELDEFGSVQLFAAEDMVRGTLLNSKAESMAGGSCALVSPCRTGSDLPFGILRRTVLAGERIHREDIGGGSDSRESRQAHSTQHIPGEDGSSRKATCRRRSGTSAAIKVRMA